MAAKANLVRIQDYIHSLDSKPEHLFKGIVYWAVSYEWMEHLREYLGKVMSVNCYVKSAIYRKCSEIYYNYGV